LAASKKESSRSKHTQVELNAKFVEKDDDIEKPQVKGVKQMTVKTSIMGRLVLV
jgi:hypothetical protein